MCRISFSKLAPKKESVIRILRVGIPSGLQSMLFAFSNVLIQSTVNSYGETVISGNATASNIDSFVYICIASIAQAIIVFAGQNMGAGKYKRLDRVLLCGLGIVVIIGAFTSSLVIIFARPLLNFFTPGSPEIVEAGMRRLWIVCVPYLLCGLMDSTASFNKGIGKQIVPTLIVLIGTCLFRVIWILTVCRIFPGSPETPNNIYYLYLSYPITWAIAFVGNLIYYFMLRKKLMSGQLNVHV